MDIRRLCRLADTLEETLNKDTSIHRVQLLFKVEIEREALEYLIELVNRQLKEQTDG